MNARRHRDPDSVAPLDPTPYTTDLLFTFTPHKNIIDKHKPMANPSDAMRICKTLTSEQHNRTMDALGITGEKREQLSTSFEEGMQAIRHACRPSKVVFGGGGSAKGKTRVTTEGLLKDQASLLKKVSGLTDWTKCANWNPVKKCVDDPLDPTVCVDAANIAGDHSTPVFSNGRCYDQHSLADHTRGLPESERFRDGDGNAFTLEDARKMDNSHLRAMAENQLMGVLYHSTARAVERNQNQQDETFETMFHRINGQEGVGWMRWLAEGLYNNWKEMILVAAKFVANTGFSIGSYIMKHPKMAAMIALCVKKYVRQLCQAGARYLNIGIMAPQQGYLAQIGEKMPSKEFTVAAVTTAAWHYASSEKFKNSMKNGLSWVTGVVATVAGDIAADIVPGGQTVKTLLSGSANLIMDGVAEAGSEALQLIIYEQSVSDATLKFIDLLTIVVHPMQCMRDNRVQKPGWIDPNRIVEGEGEFVLAAESEDAKRENEKTEAKKKSEETKALSGGATFIGGGLPEHIANRVDYDSDMGMQSSVWGPAFWFCLHIVSFNYPVRPTRRDKQRYCAWILALGDVLPCKPCRDAYHGNLRLAGLTTRPNVFTNRDTFSRFIFRLHNIIRLETGQATGMSYEEVRDKYEAFRSRCPRDLSPWRRELHMSVVPRDATRTRDSGHRTVHRTVHRT